MKQSIATATARPIWRTRNFHPPIDYVPTGAKVVRPNLSMSLTEIQRRFASGLQLPEALSASYSDVDWSEIERMNVFERKDFAAQIALKAKERRAEIQKEFQEKRKVQIDAEINRLVDERIRQSRAVDGSDAPKEV